MTRALDASTWTPPDVLARAVSIRMEEQRRRRFCLIGALVLVLAACDTFFELDLVVTDCVTGKPLEGVDAVTSADDEPDHRERTDAAGKLFISLNKPDGVTVTLTLTKTGYKSWTKQFQGEPAKPYPICLEPAQP